MDSPYLAFFYAVFGGVGIGGTIQAAKYLREIIAERKKARAERERAQITDSVDRQRIDNESDEATFRRATEMLRLSELEVKRLTEMLDKSRLSPSLVRKLGREISSLEWMVRRLDGHENLIVQIEILKSNFDDLEKTLP